MGTDIRALTKALEAIKRRPIAASVTVHVATLLAPRVDLSNPETCGPTLTHLMKETLAVAAGVDTTHTDPNSVVGMLTRTFLKAHQGPVDDLS